MNNLNDEQLNRLYDRIEQLEKENENLKEGKHAHWIHDHDVEHYGKHDGAYWRCSSCGRILKDSNWFSYCPMCGARMGEK